MSRERRYLVIRADRSMRVISRYPRLREDEIAFPLVVEFPGSWGNIQRETVTVTLPDSMPDAPTVGEPIHPTPDDEEG